MHTDTNNAHAPTHTTNHSICTWKFKWKYVQIAFILSDHRSLELEISVKIIVRFPPL